MIFEIKRKIEKKQEDKKNVSFFDQAALVTHSIQLNNGTTPDQNEKAEQILEDWANSLGISKEELKQQMVKDTQSKIYHNTADEKFTFIDLFAGIGGFRLAMQAYGGKCVFSSEFNPKAQTTYYHNYGEVPFGDITNPEVKDKVPADFDVVCGVFPSKRSR